MGKIIAIMMVSILAFSLLPASYAGWPGRWGNRDIKDTVYSHPRYQVIFTSVRFYDNEVDKDVAQIDARIVDGGKKIVTTITNAYPGYKGYLEFTVTNVGTLPVKITRVNIDNPNRRALRIRITDRRWKRGVLHPGDSRSGLVKYAITRHAAQNATYPFTITINVKQWKCRWH